MSMTNVKALKVSLNPLSVVVNNCWVCMIYLMAEYSLGGFVHLCDNLLCINGKFRSRRSLDIIQTCPVKMKWNMFFSLNFPFTSGPMGQQLNRIFQRKWLVYWLVDKLLVGVQKSICVTQAIQSKIIIIMAMYVCKRHYLKKANSFKYFCLLNLLISSLEYMWENKWKSTCPYSLKGKKKVLHCQKKVSPLWKEQ